MDQIKRFISCSIPGTACNLRCHYCYITHRKLYNKTLAKLEHSPEFIRKAFSRERWGGICLINICGDGETLLPLKIVDYVRSMLEEGHYVMIVTNGLISKRFDEIIQFDPELLKRLFFKFSYHYIELKKRNLLEDFFGNINKVHSAGASFTLEATPSDELIPYIDDVKKESLKYVGAINHLTVARDETVEGTLPILTQMDRESYKKTWEVFDSSLFDYKLGIFEEKRKEFCYAGDWSVVVDLESGNMDQCYCSFLSQNIYEDINNPIRFMPVGNNCTEKHCYNGHAFLALGTIPELKAPTYADLRNKVCRNGKEWLYPEMKAFMNTRLYENNKEYSDTEKKAVNRKITLLKRTQTNIISKIKRRIKQLLK